MSIIHRRYGQDELPQPITLVGVKTVSCAGTGTASLNLSTGLTGGIASSARYEDFVCVMVAGHNAGFSYPSITTSYWGNTRQSQTSSIFANDTNDTNMRVYYGMLDKNSGLSCSISGAGSGNGGVAVAMVFRYVDPVTYADAAISTTTGIDEQHVNPPSRTPSTSGAIIIAGGASGHTSGSTSFTSPDLSNLTQLASNTTRDLTGGMGWYDWTSGAFDPGAWTSSASTTSDSWSAFTLAVRPKYPGV